MFPPNYFRGIIKIPCKKFIFCVGEKYALTNTKLFVRATIDLCKKIIKILIFFEDKSYSKIQRKIKRNA